MRMCGLSEGKETFEKKTLPIASSDSNNIHGLIFEKKYDMILT